MHVLKKRGVSQIVATVLLVLLVIVAVGVVTPILVKIIKGNLEGEGDCFTSADELKISRADYAYNCYDKQSNTVNVTVYRGDIEMDRFYVRIIGVITETVEKINFPAKNGGERTYEIKLTDTLNDPLPRVTIYPEIGGKTCDVTDDIALESCS